MMADNTISARLSLILRLSLCHVVCGLVLTRYPASCKKCEAHYQVRVFTAEKVVMEESTEGPRSAEGRQRHAGGLFGGVPVQGQGGRLRRPPGGIAGSGGQVQRPACSLHKLVPNKLMQAITMPKACRRFG